MTGSSLRAPFFQNASQTVPGDGGDGVTAETTARKSVNPPSPFSPSERVARPFPLCRRMTRAEASLPGGNVGAGEAAVGAQRPKTLREGGFTVRFPCFFLKMSLMSYNSKKMKKYLLTSPPTSAKILEQTF